MFGGRGMGQTCGVADPSQWMRIFGVDIDSRDTTLLLETARAVTPAEVEAARAQIQPYFSVPIPDDPASERSIRLYVALKKLVAQEGWDFYTIQSFPGLGDDYSATCFAQSMMVQDGVPTATLSDFNTTMSVKLLMDLSDERVYYGDLQHIDKATREIKIIGDGACPPGLTGTLEPVTFAEHGIPTEGAAGGLSIQAHLPARRGGARPPGPQPRRVRTGRDPLHRGGAGRCRRAGPTQGRVRHSVLAARVRHRRV